MEDKDRPLLRLINGIEPMANKRVRIRFKEWPVRINIRNLYITNFYVSLDSEKKPPPAAFKNRDKIKRAVQS